MDPTEFDVAYLEAKADWRIKERAHVAIAAAAAKARAVFEDMEEKRQADMDDALETLDRLDKLAMLAMLSECERKSAAFGCPPVRVETNGANGANGARMFLFGNQGIKRPRS